MDPIDLRLKNAAKKGTKTAYGVTFNTIGMVETLEAAKNSPHYKTPVKPGYARGVAAGFWFNVGADSSAAAHVGEDGSVTVISGNPDIGGSRASLALMAAEELGVDYDKVRPVIADTASIGFNFVTGGSRVTFATGLAAYKLGLDLVEQMKDRAAQLWNCEPASIKVEDGKYSHNGEKLGFKELAAKLSQKNLPPVMGRASVAPEGSTNGFGTHIVDVEVDPETGKVSILRYTAIQDAGKAIHPSYVEGQMQGGAVQGIGWALNEEYWFDDQNRMRNASFLDYRIPTCLDVPLIETIIVEVPNPNHPFGVRGVGETPIVPPPAAIANAIYRATGKRLTDLPMSPPKVWKALSH
jgi:CO/xanthine dehydrogenase Mo-binding subunit